MRFKFSAKIYKVGINPCVKVPLKITARMLPERGYIPVRGKIEAHTFRQTLVPVKNAEYRLYVNGPMLKGAEVSVGQIANFIIEQDAPRALRNYPVPKEFRKQLHAQKLLPAFNNLLPSRKKDILKYLNYLRTEEALLRNIKKVIRQLATKKL
jgi:hypothetical protein